MAAQFEMIEHNLSQCQKPEQRRDLLRGMMVLLDQIDGINEQPALLDSKPDSTIPSNPSLREAANNSASPARRELNAIPKLIVRPFPFRDRGMDVVCRPAVAIRYEIRRKLANCESLCIAEFTDRKQADQLAQSLNQHWPGEYEVLEVVADGSP